MNTGEKIDYMIQCLQVAKGEAMFLDEYDSKNWGTDMRWLSMHRAPNKACRISLYREWWRSTGIYHSISRRDKSR